jgi:hypothetical protein
MVGCRALLSKCLFGRPPKLLVLVILQGHNDSNIFGSLAHQSVQFTLTLYYICYICYSLEKKQDFYIFRTFFDTDDLFQMA